MISTFSVKLTDWLRLRASFRELSRLSDRELSDLGIERAGIPALLRKAGAVRAA